ncbi:MAG: hypothetical protein R3E39_17565 [Anaerolineae bacterium]
MRSVPSQLSGFVIRHKRFVLALTMVVFVLIALVTSTPFILPLGIFVSLYIGTSQNEHTGATFIRRFTIFGALFLIVLASFNYIVNPLGIYPPHWFEPLIWASRNQKMNLFAAYNPPPQALVLGSSRSFTIAPTQIEALWGYRTFNASLTASSVRDYLAYTRFALESGANLKLIIVNISVETFREFDVHSAEPDASLWDYLENNPLSGLATRFDQITRLVSAQQTDASLQLLNAERNGRGQPHYYFDDEGQGHFYEALSLDVAVDTYIKNGWGTAFQLSSYDLADSLGVFEQFLDLCRRENIRVIGYMPPYHPKLLQYITSNGDYIALETQILHELDRVKELDQFDYVNFVHSYPLTDLEATFYDAVHPKPEAAANMMQALHDAFPLTEAQS